MADDLIFEQNQRRVRGRGTGKLIKNRFEEVEITYADEEERQIKTQVFRDSSRSIISYNGSPDVGLNATINIYRGCEHGCIYCYARPTHEYFGLSSGLDFETKIFVKFDAPKLLREALNKKSFTPQPLGISGVTDSYQPIEKKLKLTRQCLKVLANFKNPIVIITKNHLVTRDIDILATLASYNAVNVVLSITTLDESLARAMEPRASSPKRRLDAIALLSDASIPVSINMAPIIPGLTDHEIPALLKAAKERGANSANYTVVRLPYGVKDIFSSWLLEKYPAKHKKIINRIEEMRAGKLNSSAFFERMRGQGIYAESIAAMFKRYRDLHGLNQCSPLSTAHFERPEDKDQLSFF